MSAFTQVPSLVTFSPLTTALSADVNANYAAIRNAFNGLVSGSNTISVDTITENTLSAGITFSKVATFSAGITVASGQNVTASGATFTGKPTFSTGLTITTGGAVTASGVAFAVGALVVSGITTFATNVTCSAALDVAGVASVPSIVVSNALAVASTTLIHISYNTLATYFEGNLGTTTLIQLVDGGSVSGAFVNVGATSTRAGAVNVRATGGAYLKDSIQVVGARKTGWTIPTGTLQRTGFATTTATLLDVVQTVAALVADLHSTSATLSATGHGLIGT